MACQALRRPFRQAHEPISCTNLITIGAIPELERRLGKPVVSANQATVWHACRLAGVPWSEGFGTGRLWAAP